MAPDIAAAAAMVAEGRLIGAVDLPGCVTGWPE
jgi:hypothetical protein